MSRPSIKEFNTAGPCVLSDHYMLPVLPRQLEVRRMIEGKYYFILHAPRQSGKTTFLDFLTDDINSEGRFYAINCSLASLRGITDDDNATTRIVSQINQAMVDSQVNLIKQKADTYDLLPGMKDSNRKIRTILRALCQDLDKELIFFFR
ncbi:MAG: hypothetical protein LBR53_04795 [Deltaproteobacteria bacterium]|jgi:predicted ATP-binding protein involved in virulence|nr:hypothetical protein [Deltaproteobacteria bacterium]